MKQSVRLAVERPPSGDWRRRKTYAGILRSLQEAKFNLKGLCRMKASGRPPHHGSLISQTLLTVQLCGREERVFNWFLRSYFYWAPSRWRGNIGPGFISNDPLKAHEKPKSQCGHYKACESHKQANQRKPSDPNQVMRRLNYQDN